MAPRKPREIRDLEFVFCEIPQDTAIQDVNYQDLFYEYLFQRGKNKDSHVSVQKMMTGILERQLVKVEALSKEEKIRVTKRGLKYLLSQKEKYEKIRKEKDDKKCFNALVDYFQSLQGKVHLMVLHPLYINK